MGTGPAVGEGTDEEGIVPKAASDYDGVGQVCWAGVLWWLKPRILLLFTSNAPTTC